MPSLAELLGLAWPGEASAADFTPPSTTADAADPWWLQSASIPPFFSAANTSASPFSQSPFDRPPENTAADAARGGLLGSYPLISGGASSPSSGGILQGVLPGTGQNRRPAAISYLAGLLPFGLGRTDPLTPFRTPASNSFMASLLDPTRPSAWPQVAAPNWNPSPSDTSPLGWPIAPGTDVLATQADAPAPTSPQTGAAEIDSQRSALVDFFQSIPRGMLSGLASTASANGQAAQIEMLQPVDVPPAERATDILEQNVTGPLPRPRGTGGQFGATVGEFLANPMTYLFPGGIGTKLATAATSALGSEAVGQLTQGTWAEPFARIGGAVLGGGVGASAARQGAAAVKSARGIVPHTEAAPGKSEPIIGQADIEDFRARIGVPYRHTVAIARTNAPGLENMKFEGASPSVRMEGGLPRATAESIESPSSSARYRGHAEEDVANQFIRAVKERGLESSDLDGRTLAIHISNPKGVCRVCLWGFGETKAEQAPGVLKQLSQIYPGLFIRVTVETKSGITPRSPVDFTIHDGKLVFRSEQ